MTRPIPDRVKESVFSLLRGHYEGASVFDAFAGTGAIGLEALSRGAARVVFVERDKAVAEVLMSNIEMLGVGDRAELVTGDALGAGALARAPRPLTMAFFDPPYPLMRDPLGFKRIMAQVSAIVDRIEPKCFVVLRTPWPLFIEPGEAEPAAPDRKKGGEKKPRKEDWKRQLRDAQMGLDPEEIRKRAKKRTGRDILAGPEDAEEMVDL
ncbi:MAG: RsmD family RNA methyltransferase, partial [Phycisphaerales bacterium]